MKRIWVNITLRIISSHLIATEMRTYLKSIAYFLLALILFQSCVSATSVTGDKAVEGSVRRKTIEGETYHYKKLIRKDSILYGVKKMQGVGLVEQDLSNLNIIEVRYLSPGKTAVLVVVSVVGFLFIGLFIIVSISGISSL